MNIEFLRKTCLTFLLLKLLSLHNLHCQGFSDPFQVVRNKPLFIYGIDNRRTHIHEQSTVIYGVYAGMGFGDRLRFKFGVAGTPFERGRLKDKMGNLTKHRLLFCTIGEEFDFFSINKFRFTTYVQGGIGYNYYRLIQASGIANNVARKIVYPLEMGLHSSYALKPWLALKLGAGWRFVFQSNSLNGYYIKLGIGIKASELMKAFQKQRLLNDSNGLKLE